MKLMLSVRLLAAVLLVRAVSASDSAPAATSFRRTIPVIYSTDLLHPHEDPDDHFDLACMYAMPEVDLRAIILDNGAAQAQRPGSTPVRQLNRLSGRQVPHAIGLLRPLNSPDDRALDQPAEHQNGVNLLLKTLRESQEKVAIIFVGSARDTVAAFNREPALFRAKVRSIHGFIGEASDPTYIEYNVSLDPQAYVGLLRSGLPVYWIPCFDGGLWRNNGHASYWSIRHREVLDKAPEPLLRYFLYMLRKETSDPIAYLSLPISSEDRQWLMDGKRNLWAAAFLGMSVGRSVPYEGQDVAGFAPVTLSVNERGAVRLAAGPDSRRVERFEIKDTAHFAAAATAMTAQVLAAFPLSGSFAPAMAATSGFKERVFQESREIFANPERGFYSPVKTGRVRNLDDLRQRSISLLLVETDLRDFKERDLSQEKLAEIRDALAAARRAGLKVIFRAAYGYTNRDYRTDPKDMSRILGHIRQMGAVLTENADVLCGVQAGMLGPWGEWHGSNWGDPPSLEARRNVLFGWLDSLPASITVDIRRPMFIRDIYADEGGGSTLSEENAYSGSRLSRTGFHDDSFLSLPTDSGTFVEPGWNRERELKWCSQHGRFTPSGGETVPTSVRTPVTQVVSEMELFHTSYLNIAYHSGTLEGWRRAEYGNESAFQHIARRLGYRFVAQRLRYPARVKAGETCPVELTLTNVGFASPHLPREVAFALSRGEEKPTQPLRLKEADPRRWGAEAGTVTLRTEIPVPSDSPAGKWRLMIRLGDPSPSLREDGRYAIRLANEEIVFIEQTGWNILANDIAIE